MTASPVTRQDLFREIGAFALTLACALFFRWDAGDLIWGLWISSLCVGYAFILSTLLSGIVFAGNAGVPLGLRLGGGILLLGFFTIHFGGFHFGHSVFLNLFFPLPQTGSSPGNDHPFTPLITCLRLYWPLVLSTFISRLPELWPRSPEEDAQETGSRRKDPFLKPYANVIRMHLLIFVFAGLSIVNASHLAIYPVLACYFFPWAAVFRKKKKPDIPQSP